MNIELPETFYYGNQQIVVDGILKIPSPKDVWYCIREITMSLKGDTCWYCGKKLNKNNITLDHLYPHYLGGPTISNNLVPACSECNSKKGNLTEYQYKNIKKAPEKIRREIKCKILKKNEQVRLRKGYYLPKKWTTTKECNSIIANWFMCENYKGTKYARIEEFYSKSGHLPYPIVVDKNNFLLDGLLVLIFAKNNGISKVPAVVLENVEVIVNN